MLELIFSLCALRSTVYANYFVLHEIIVGVGKGSEKIFSEYFTPESKLRLLILLKVDYINTPSKGPFHSF